VFSGKSEFWSKAIQEELKSSLMKIETLSNEESDALLSLLPGGEFNSLTAGDIAITNKGDFVTLLGYTSNWIELSKIDTLIRQDKDKFMKEICNFDLEFEFSDAK